MEHKLARIAEAQHGVVARAQLLAAGISAGEIERRVRKGALLREHRGVYRVGHRAPSLHSRYMAAVCACGEGSVLSGPAAGHLLTPQGLAARSGGDDADLPAPPVFERDGRD